MIGTANVAADYLFRPNVT